MTSIDGRTVLLRSAAGVLSLRGPTACGGSRSSALAATSASVQRAEAARRRSGQRRVAARLSPRLVTVDLGGKTASTWAYGESMPDPLKRATSGEQLRVVVENVMPAETSVGRQGIALRNDMDGVPGLTQRPIDVGAEFTYEFTVQDPGTYFYHPQSGVQLDRGLYGVFVLDNPTEPGDYDVEWVVVLDDWVDGIGRTPDDVLAGLQAASAGDARGMDGGMQMGGTDHESMGEGGMSSPLLGGAGQSVLLRIVNAGSDTAFMVALGGHRMTVTHSDGFPVTPQETDALLLGMGERHDVTVTLGDGVFPLMASAEGKDDGKGVAMVRTSSAPGPSEAVLPQKHDRWVLTGADLRAADVVARADAPMDPTRDLVLSGAMAPCRWTINGATFEDADPLEVREGERIRLRVQNMSMMFPPHARPLAHVRPRAGWRPQGHRDRAAHADPGRRSDADNPGQWATQCHNIFRVEAGMMTKVSYRA